jgi:hypothetical protein
MRSVVCRRWVRGQREVPRRGGDLTSNPHVALRHAAILGFLRDQADSDPVGPQVDGRRVIVDAREVPDRLDEPSALREGRGRKVGAGTLAEDPPVLGAAGRLELRRDVVGHVSNLVIVHRWSACWGRYLPSVDVN